MYDKWEISLLFGLFECLPFLQINIIVDFRFTKKRQMKKYASTIKIKLYNPSITTSFNNHTLLSIVESDKWIKCAVNALPWIISLFFYKLPWIISNMWYQTSSYTNKHNVFSKYHFLCAKTSPQTAVVSNTNMEKIHSFIGLYKLLPILKLNWRANVYKMTKITNYIKSSEFKKTTFCTKQLSNFSPKTCLTSIQL